MRRPRSILKRRNSLRFAQAAWGCATASNDPSSPTDEAACNTKFVAIILDRIGEAQCVVRARRATVFSLAMPILQQGRCEPSKQRTSALQQ